MLQQKKLLSKKWLILSSLILLSFGIIFIATPKAQAKPLIQAPINNFAITCTKPYPTFFGLVPWYNYLTVTQDPQAPDNCAVSFNLAGNGGKISNLSEIWLIGLAVFEDLLRVAGLVAVGFVIYGGIRYITSGGDPEATKGAMSTIMNALIGLAIAVLAATTISLIAGKIGS